MDDNEMPPSEKVLTERIAKLENQNPVNGTNRRVTLLVRHYDIVDADGVRREVPVESLSAYDTEHIDWDSLEAMPNGIKIAIMYPTKADDCGHFGDSLTPKSESIVRPSGEGSK